MPNRLDGKRIAILATDGFEEVELTKPMQALKEEGARVEVVSPKPGSIQGFQHDRPGQSVPVDRTLQEAKPDDYDGLMLPGGLFNPDTLRTDEKALAFTRAFFAAGKPVAAICHGPQILISADLVKGRTMTGWQAIQKDLANAGATVRDEPVVTDKGLVTSRRPDDIPQFCAKMIEEFAEGRHKGRQQAA
jgi:protease I